ncbi:MAG TPA: TonB-dependent hemoglobin/transferrin/lactoferrin family receptor [Afipia sp.]
MPRVLTTTTTRKELDDKQIDNLEDFARRIDAGVNFNQDNNSINIRGLDSNRVLTLIDGIPLPWMNDGARGVEGGINNFAFNTLSSIDVVKTSDSSFFGSGALGGVLALRTISPEDILKGGKQFGGVTKFTYDSADRSWMQYQALAARASNTLFMVQQSYQQGHELDNMGTVGGVGTTRTEKDPSDYIQRNFLVKLHQYFDEGGRLAITGESFSRDEDINTLTSVGSTYSSYNTEEVRKRKRISAAYDYNSGGFLDEAHLNLYWQKVNFDTNTSAYRLTSPAGTYNRDSDLEESTYGVVGSATKNFTTQSLNHSVSFGGQFFSTKTKQYAAGEDSCTPGNPACMFLHVNQSDMPNVDGNKLGLFVQDKIGFLNDQFRLTPGLRYDWYQLKPQETATYALNAAYEGQPPSSSDSKFSPKLLAEWDFAPKATVYFQWAQAFRPPTATEMYLTYGGSGTYVSIGNPDLKPETSNGYEAGVKLGDKDFGGGVSLYDNYYKNFIDTVTMTAAEAGLSGSYPYGVFKYVNRASVHIYGAEANMHWRFAPGWRTWASLAYSVGKDTEENTYLNSIPPLRAILGLGYATDIWGTDISVTMASSRNNVEVPTSDLNKTPAYAIADLTAWWEPVELKGLRVQAGLFNMFNAKYYNAMNIPDSSTIAKEYYTNPGRSYKVGMIYKF